jgi:predicted O-methyltransferase YrrM
MSSTVTSDAVAGVLRRLHAKSDAEDPLAKQRVSDREANIGRRLSAPERSELYGDAPLAISREVGELYYVLALSRRARLIVEFGASHGISTIYLAAAIRDAGRGSLMTTELLPRKAQAARQNLAEAQLDDLVEIRVGDATTTLEGLEGPVDLLVLDGRNDQYETILQLVEPQLAPDALVLADLGKDDPDLRRYRTYVRNADHGYFSIELPLDAGLEISARIPSGSAFDQAPKS